MLRKFWNDEEGFIISAELVLVATITVISLVVGLSEIAVAINTELDDVANAIGCLNQSYAFTGFHAIDTKFKAATAGARFDDAADDCDKTTSCDIVCGPPHRPNENGLKAW